MEIGLLKIRLEREIYGGVVLWWNDLLIPDQIIDPFITALLPSLGAHYGVNVDSALYDIGKVQLLPFFSIGYDADTVEIEADDISVTLIDTTAVAVGDVTDELKPLFFISVSLSGSDDDISATFSIYGSNHSAAPTTDMKTVIWTTTLQGTAVGTDVVVTTASAPCYIRFKYYWASVTDISGTDASITITAEP